MTSGKLWPDYNSFRSIPWPFQLANEEPHKWKVATWARSLQRETSNGKRTGKLTGSRRHVSKACTHLEQVWSRQAIMYAVDPHHEPRKTSEPTASGDGPAACSLASIMTALLHFSCNRVTSSPSGWHTHIYHPSLLTTFFPSLQLSLSPAPFTLHW